MENQNHFAIAFKNKEEGEFFVRKIMIDSLMYEVEERALSGKEVEANKVETVPFFKLLTEEIFYDLEIDVSILQDLLMQLAKDINFSFFINYSTKGFAYVFDDVENNKTELLFGIV